MYKLLTLLGFRIWYTNACIMLQNGRLRINVYPNRVSIYRSTL